MGKVEIEVKMEAAYSLAGTLTLPNEGDEKFPLIVMVHGSGDLDRDENTRKMRINAFRELSDLAVGLGFATLRYDKRGVGASEGDYFAAGVQDLIDDAVAVIRFGKAHANIDENKVVVLGHSEGSILAPAIHDIEPVNGLILIAGTAECLTETLVWQRALMKEDIKTAKGFEGFVLKLLKVDKKLDKINQQMIDKLNQTDEAVLRFKGRKINAKWNREHGEFDVSEYLPKVDVPVLAVTGTKDVQVKPEQVHDIASLVKGDSEAHLITDMTHMLRKTSVEPRFSKILKDYKKQVKQPIEQELMDIVGNWLKKYK